MSAVWSHFRLGEDRLSVTCTHCQKKMKRTDSSTKSMWGHLQSFHTDEVGQHGFSLKRKRCTRQLKGEEEAGEECTTTATTRPPHNLIFGHPPLLFPPFLCPTLSTAQTPTQPYVKRKRPREEKQLNLSTPRRRNKQSPPDTKEEEEGPSSIKEDTTTTPISDPLASLNSLLQFGSMPFAPPLIDASAHATSISPAHILNQAFMWALMGEMLTGKGMRVGGVEEPAITTPSQMTLSSPEGLHAMHQVAMQLNLIYSARRQKGGDGAEHSFKMADGGHCVKRITLHQAPTGEIHLTRESDCPPELISPTSYEEMRRLLNDKCAHYFRGE